MIANVIRSCFPVAAKAVADKAEDINKLNVFPVPDGDTGTNMSLTLGTVVKEVKALPAGASMADVAKAITHGSLMGARGNSGVITSQILRGMAEGLVSAHDPVTTADVAAAFRNSVKVAFKAVRKPVEGTILTVIRDVSARADKAEKEKLTVSETLEALVVEAYESVARTPDLLPVLKENGVVDSGAYGFATFLEAFVNAILGNEGKLTEFDTSVAPADAHSVADSRVQIELNDDWEGSEFRYCNEFLFKAEKGFDADAALSYLATLGDCELVVGSFPDYKVHVHSNEPNCVLEYMLRYGQIYEVFIHNMDIEAHDRTAKIAADQAKAEVAAAESKPAVPKKP
ncbi:DAK2 domain-containing protein, partial [uncultured Parolsenella sp.]|uniref:DAK2 domain-containing protein n=1 Tax=uncultured Parolsenella sp. TaxID=2083008 RepID=UPI0027D96D3E